MALKNKTDMELIKEIIDLGMQIEAEDYNAGRFAGYGFTRNKIPQLRTKARNRIAILEERGIDVYEIAESGSFKGIEDENPQLYGPGDLAYNLQFI